MNKTVFQLIDDVLAREGGYVNDPNDAGGETKYGITKAVAHEEGYRGNMKDLQRGVAAAIYRQRYWIKPNFYRVSSFAPTVAAELFDTGINMGPGTASKMLQRALNALNRNGKDYPDITADGAIGPATLAAVEAYMKVRGSAGETVLVHALDALQGERYIELAERRPANENFLYGWLANRLGNAA